MLTDADELQFQERGYVVVPSVLDMGEVESLRRDLRPRFDVPSSERPPGDDSSLLNDAFRRFSSVRELVYRPAVISAWRSLLGRDLVVLREATVHLNRFGGWHADTTSQERAGLDLHWSEDFLMVQTAFYLQENSPEWGGGLDVQPGSHHRPSPPPASSGMLQRVARKLRTAASDDPENRLTIQSQPGDMVMFDFRVQHRASQPTRSFSPGEHEKLAIFIAVSRNNGHVAEYHDYLASRSDYPWLDGSFSYPSDLVAEAEVQGVELA